MAIVKATYTKLPNAIKASIRYYTSRPELSGRRGDRTIFGKDGILSKQDAYAIINRQSRGTYFYRIVLSPDPNREDANRALSLESLTRKTLWRFASARRGDLTDFAAVCHTDHSPNRHVHVVACFSRKLNKADLAILRGITTSQALGHERELELDTPRRQDSLNRRSPRPARKQFQARGDRRASPRPLPMKRVVFVAQGAIYPAPKHRPACMLCRMSAKLVWRYGTLRCSYCGFAAKSSTSQLIKREARESGGLELQLSLKHWN